MLVRIRAKGNRFSNSNLEWTIHFLGRCAGDPFLTLPKITSNGWMIRDAFV